MTRTSAWLAIGGLLVILFGCASAPKQEATARMVWPPPPLAPRIEFIRSIASDQDVGRDTTFSQKLTMFVGGETPGINQIAEPTGVAVSDDGERLYVADFMQLQVFVFDFAHKTFTKIGNNERLARPMGIALDAQENLYVVEEESKGISVFNRQGKKTGFITDPSISRPTGIAIDRERGKIYLSDTSHTKTGEHSIKVFNLSGKLIGSIGKKGTQPGEFLFPTYLTVDAKGNLYVADTLNSRVQMFDHDGKYLKSFGSRGSAWGMFDKPKGVAVDSFGNLYVVDSGWSNVQIFNEKGEVLLFFGGRGPIPGMMKNPNDIAISKDNHIYVADYLNHRIDVYRLVNTTATDSFSVPPTQNSGK